MSTSPEPVQPPPAFSITHPLDEFYRRSGLPLPPCEQIDGELVPEPYKTLLVHQNDMTPTLESFHKGVIRLHVLSREQRGNEYFREVVLQMEGSGQPVEFGAIKMHLERFAPGVRKRILFEQWPLGHLLKEFSVPHTSRPTAFLRIASDELINRMFGLTGAHVLFGRRNTLFSGASKRALAEIVEILPPVAAVKRDA